MRPNQNNKNRQRGRNNNGGRKHVNPLSRNFESNGPDVKVRGNAAHIAEKYLQLARDAQSSGDPVLAENYLQHAEHYFRIVAAAQAQSQFRPDQPGQVLEVDEDDDFPPINDRFASPESMQRFQQPQPQPGSIYAWDPRPMSEDCLSLNIWAPAGARKAPVFFWIHGGALTSGAGSDRLYDGAALASRGLVVVAINYRLGVLGFLAHPQLSAESSDVSTVARPVVHDHSIFTLL